MTGTAAGRRRAVNGHDTAPADRIPMGDLAVEAERQLLGAALIGITATAAAVVHSVDPADLQLPSHARILHAVADDLAAGGVPTPLTVNDRLRAAGEDLITGAELVAFTGAVVATSDAHIARLAGIVADAAARRRLAAAGTTLAARAADPTIDLAATTAEVTATLTRTTSRAVQRSTWAPVPLSDLLDGDPGDGPLPTLLHRTDGLPLLYPGRVHALVGESESGKTWLALLAVVQVLAAGDVAAFVDFEDDEHGITARLRALGATVDQLRRQLIYVHPDEPLEGRATIDLEAILALRPALAVIDGVNEALSLHGLSSKDDVDVAAFQRLLPRRFAAAGAAVVLVDHVVKAADQRGRWATGSQHKLAGLDGAQYVVEPIQTWAAGKGGRSHIRVAKDRPGQVRRHLADRGTVGDLVAHTWPDERLDLTIEPGAAPRLAADGQHRPTTLMEKISRYLAAHTGEDFSTNQVRKAVRGDDTAKDRALDVLVLEDYVTRTTVGRAKYHRHARLFTEENDRQENADDA